ncbi:MAG: hypothetical protein WC701_11005 [Kiritimatiellales bacterium]|jgi:hypothetical protein
MNGDISTKSAHHPALDKLANAETRCDTIANDETAIRDYLVKKIVTEEEAAKVLKLLIKDCEKLARDPDLSPRTRSELIKGATGWKVELESGCLSMDDLCGLIESIYGIIVAAKKQCARFDAHCPANITHLEEGKAFVLKITGIFEISNNRGIRIFDSDF